MSPLLLLLVCCAWSAYSMENSIASSGCSNANWIANSTISYNYSFDGHNREYIVHIPSNYQTELALPVIFALPGFDIWPGYWSERFGMQMQGNVHNFISVITTGLPYPSPPNSTYPTITRAWNDLACSGSSTVNGTKTCNQTKIIESYWYSSPPVPTNCSDGGITINGTFYDNACNWCSCHNNDIQFIRELTTHIENEYCVDITREYVLGFSNGGMMTQRMACEANDIFAAAAAFHGQMHVGFNCKPKYSQAMPFMNVWGLRDRSVPGMAVYGKWGWYWLTVQQVQKRFAEFNGCDIDVAMTDIETISDGIQGWQCKSYDSNCRNDAFTMLCQWNGTHDYPTNGSKFSAYYNQNMSSAPPGFNFGLAAAWQYLSQFQRMEEVSTTELSTTETIEVTDDGTDGTDSPDGVRNYSVEICMVVMAIGILFV